MNSPQFLLYLSKKKPKMRMPDIHKTGVFLKVTGSTGGAFATQGSLGDFDVILKDIPDVLLYGGR